MHSIGLVSLLFSAALGAAVTEGAWERQLAKGAELGKLGRYAEAREVFQRARDQAAQLDPRGSDLAVALNNLGTVELRLNHIAEAEQCYRRSAEIWELRGDAINRIAPVTNLAAVYVARRQFSSAERLLNGQMRLAQEKLGPDHSQISVILTYFADTAFVQGNYSAAAEFDERALQIVRKNYRVSNPLIAIALDNLGTIYRAQHRLQESSRAFTEALEIMQASGQPDHPAWIGALTDFSTVRCDEGRYDEARALLEQALARAENALGANHPTIASILRDYALVLRKMRRKGAAKKAEARAARILAQSARENQLGYTVDLRTLSGFR